ncbi:trimeric intracellular cation channel family protein [Lachnoclostridium edouardi]|uniref:trimeric intracellular cation channel family protein n=1 Tax=Lachnoclostridium edouardi TaxID=1926283 RepID=UPI000C7C9570|nr:trimeric intracellular cation channel family protein [Lachnoclostridium edouardi]
MELHWSILFAMETIGTIAFASSGAMVAIEKNLDLLGVIVLGVTTAVGGGMLRDIIIGNIPPNLFVNPVYVFMALATVIILFLIIRFHRHFLFGRSRITYEKIMNIFDAVGLGAFTVVGIDTAVSSGYGEYHFLAAFLGVMTGVGGGILRDIMADQTPYILKKHVYASASIAGAVAYILLAGQISSDSAMIICSVLVVAIRLLATKYRWNLPTALGNIEKGDIVRDHESSL